MRRLGVFFALASCYLWLSIASSPAALTTQHMGSVYDSREQDLRYGAVVYQILVDRFAPSHRLEAKKQLYPAPKVLHCWTDLPVRGVDLPDQKLNSQELSFWGGDFETVTSRLDHVRGLGATVVYLNPIHLARTNHKYDALDFKAIFPEFGTREEFKTFASEAHRLGMKVILDGVFNHMGRNAPAFQEALKDPQSRWRPWFAIGPEYSGGARVWTGCLNLPELNLEHPPVRQYLYEAPDSVVRSYLCDGPDGWRLETAFELGHRYLQDLRVAACKEEKDALIVSEIVNYPDAWLQSMDGVMNFTPRQILLGLAEVKLSPYMTARDRVWREGGPQLHEPHLRRHRS